MAQTLRPIADIFDGTWTDQAGGTTLFDKIDEAVLDTADYIKSVDAPANTPSAVDLATGIDPVSSTGHIIHAVARNGVAGGIAVDLTVQLRQGYTGEGAQGTLISTLTQASVAGSFTEYTKTLSGAEADAITDYSDLQLRPLANQP